MKRSHDTDVSTAHFRPVAGESVRCCVVCRHKYGQEDFTVSRRCLEAHVVCIQALIIPHESAQSSLITRLPLGK